MKILHAYNQHRGGGGADNAARATIEVSRRHGHEVEVFTRSSEQLPKNLLGRLTAGAGAIYARASVKAFDAQLASFKPDVVHIHEVFPLVSPWILPRCTRRGVPVVMTTVDYRMTCPIVTHLRDGQTCTRCCGGHEYWAVLKNCRENMAESLTVSLYNAMTRKLGLFHRHISRFIAPSDFTRNWFIEHAGIEPGRITTNSPVVEMPEDTTDAGAGTYIAFAGRFAPEKGVGTLLDAAQRCGLPFRLSRNEQSRVTVDLTVNGGDVDTVVTRSRDELHAFYRGARMLVLPSVWFETFALVGAEAMSHGVPVVASRFGAMECLIEDGVDGLLFKPGDANDLAEKVKQLWADPARCRRMGEAARRKAMKLWAPERHVERLNKLYAEVCCAAQEQPSEIPAAAACEEAYG